MISVIDTGIGNLASVQRAFSAIGAQTQLISDPDLVRSADAIVLPGVGAFRDGMKALNTHGMVTPLREAAATGKPILGFCLGMQLLASVSEEFGEYEGLGLVPGRVRALTPGPNERVPNIGWCDVITHNNAKLFEGIPEASSFYFVHSYHLQCDNPEHIAATIQFGNDDITVALEHGNIFGLQCHPEKSQEAGLNVLAQFMNVVEDYKRSNS